MRYRYPDGIDKAVSDLADETQWFEEIKTFYEYTAVPLPKLNHDRQAWEKNIDSSNYDDPEIDMDEIDEDLEELSDQEEQEDEEIQALKSLKPEHKAIQNTDSVFQADEEEEIGELGTSSTEQDHWVLPRTCDAIDAWEILRKQVGRLFGVAKPALYAEAEDIQAV
jgi:hypothetical protein